MTAPNVSESDTSLSKLGREQEGGVLHTVDVGQYNEWNGINSDT